MSYWENVVDKNDKIVKIAKISGWAMFSRVVMLIINSIIAFVGFKYFSNTIVRIIFCVPLFISVIKFFVEWIEICCTKCGYTHKKMVGKVGVLATDDLAAPLEKIDSVTVEKGLFGTIFNYGTLKVNMASANYDIYFVAKPDEFKRDLIEQIDIAKKEMADYQAMKNAEAMSAAMKMAMESNNNNNQ